MVCLMIASNCWAEAPTTNPMAVTETGERYASSMKLKSLSQGELQQTMTSRFNVGETGNKDMVKVEETSINSSLPPKFVEAVTFSQGGSSKDFPEPNQMKTIFESNTQVDTDESKLDSAKVGLMRQNMSTSQQATALFGIATAFETSTYHSRALDEENGLTATVKKSGNQATTERKTIQSEAPVTYSISDSYNLKLKTRAGINMLTSLGGQEAQGSLSSLTGDGFKGMKNPLPFGQ